MLEKGPKKLKILTIIARSSRPIGSDTLATELKMHESNVIRITNDLEKRGIISCVTGRKRDRRYEITRYGRQHLDSIKR